VGGGGFDLIISFTTSAAWLCPRTTSSCKRRMSGCPDGGFLLGMVSTVGGGSLLYSAARRAIESLGKRQHVLHAPDAVNAGPCIV
jgi:hypothetical protein